MWYFAAFSLGFLGSFHCAGMCGPIALALPIYHHPRLKRQMLFLFYVLGRLVLYMLLGLLFGCFGMGLTLASSQQNLSIGLGILVLIFLLMPQTLKGKIEQAISPFQALSPLKQQMSKQLRKGSLPALFLLGLMNGLLPCGMVYMGVTGAIAQGNAMHAVVFMVFFGLGTLPVFFLLLQFRKTIQLKWGNYVKTIVPIAIACMGILFIFRGLNLGIPYISPKLELAKGFHCCHK